MAEGTGGAGMGIVVGALVVVVAIVCFVVFTGGHFGGSKQIDVNVHAPSMPAPSSPASQ